MSYKTISDFKLLGAQYDPTMPVLKDSNLVGGIANNIINDPAAPQLSAWNRFTSMFGGAGKGISDSLGDTFTQDSMFGDKGWFSPVMQGASGLMSGWLGMKNYNLGKDTLAFQKDAFNKNFAAQGRLANEQLASKQDALNSLFTPEERATRMSGEDYAKKYGVANV